MKKAAFILLMIAVMAGSAAAEQLTAIKAGKVVTVSGETFEPGIILIKGEKIEAVGGEITVPPGYNTLDYPEGTVYPGLINPMINLGISGISAVRQWNDATEKGKFMPHISAFTAFYPWSNLIANTRDFGTLTALVAPFGGTVCGKAALVNLDGWTPGDMLFKEEAALVIRLPQPRRRGWAPPAADKTEDFTEEKNELKAYISKAHKYYLRSTKGITQDFNEEFEAMKTVWLDRLPVMVSADTEKDITYAIELGKEFQLNLVLIGVYDGEAVLDKIKASGFPVVLDSMYAANKKWEDGCDKVFRLPGALAREGILFAFSSARSANAFDLPIHAGRAAAYGLPREEAVKALTLNTARILGIDGEYGSIEPGKTANLVIADGCILETSTVVKDVFIKGKKIEDKSFFQKEYRRAKEKISGETR